MDSLPTNFIKAKSEATKRVSTNRPAPFSADEFNSESIEQGSQAYVQHVEKEVAPLNGDPPLTDKDEKNEAAPSPSASGVREPAKKHTQPTRQRRLVESQKRAKSPAASADEKANIRLEIDAGIRKDMIKIKHKVGITHGVEVSYAAYFMFLHERCRAENNTASFLTDLARFTEQLKRT